jgi:hypothetical protein
LVGCEFSFTLSRFSLKLSTQLTLRANIPVSPTLKASFDENDEGCKAPSDIGNNAESEGFYIRAKVVNTLPLAERQLIYHACTGRRRREFRKVIFCAGR